MPRFIYPTPVLRQKFRGVPFGTVMFGSAERKRRLISLEIIFEVFMPM